MAFLAVCGDDSHEFGQECPQLASGLAFPVCNHPQTFCHSKFEELGVLVGPGLLKLLRARKVLGRLNNAAQAAEIVLARLHLGLKQIGDGDELPQRNGLLDDTIEGHTDAVRLERLQNCELLP